MHCSRNKLILYILSFAILFIAGLPLSAFSAALSMEYSLGFNGHFKLETWTPLTVVLENRGRATTGILEVLVTSGSEYVGDVYQTTYSLDVELPYNSTKLCAFTILINTFIHDLVIRFRQDENILLSKSINLRSYNTTKNLAVVVDDKTSPDFLAVLPQGLFPVNVRPGFLPETWYGYDSVKIIIITAEMLKSLRERQFQALVQWVKWGGYLVTASGINYGSLLEQRNQKFLPVNILGHRQFSELMSLEHFCGQALRSPDPFLVLRANIQDSEILAQEDDVPLVIQKNTGSGKILFVAFDFQTPPFSRWANRKIFWDKILSLQPEMDDNGIKPDNQKILASLLASLPVDFPNVKVVLAFLGAYVLLLKFFLRKIEKYHENRWKNVSYLLAVITIFSVASYGLFLYPRARKNLTYNSFFLMNVAGQSMIASGKYVIGIYSIKETDYDVRFGSSSYPVTHLVSYGSGKKTPNTYRLHEDPSGHRIIGFSENWSYNFFLLRSKLDFPVRGEANVDDQGDLRIKIENMTPHAFSDCLVYFDKRMFFVGDILPDQKQIKNIPHSVIRHKELFDNQEAERISRESARPKDLVKDVLLTVHSTQQSQQDTLYLIGWIETNIMEAEFSGAEIQGNDLTLITWEIPVNNT